MKFTLIEVGMPDGPDGPVGLRDVGTLAVEGDHVTIDAVSDSVRRVIQNVFRDGTRLPIEESHVGEGVIAVYDKYYSPGDEDYPAAVAANIPGPYTIREAYTPQQLAATIRL